MSLRFGFAALICALLLSSLCLADASARRCRRRRRRPQKLSLVPLLLSPKSRPSAAQRRMLALLETALSKTGRFRLEAAPVSHEQLGQEGRRLRPRYWEKLAAGTQLLKLEADRRGITLSAFSGKERRARWTTRLEAVARRPDRWRHLAQRLAAALLSRFFGERSYASTRIAFVRGGGKDSRVLVMDFDGTHLEQRSVRGHESVLPSWSPQNELTFTSYLWRNPDLFIVRRGRAYRLSRQPGLNTGARWAPDGRRLALTLSRDKNAEIYVLDRRGKVQRRLTHHRSIDTSPSWSPDGKEIVFVSARSGSPQLWLMPESGGTPRQLTTAGTYNQEPAWSPMPKSPWIAFTHQREQGGYDIWLINARTRATRRLTHRGSNKSPSWSPDGRWILYTSSLGGLWVVRPDGRCSRRIYGGHGRTPAWSGF